MKTRQIKVGGVAVGGGAPVSVQSMTNTKTEDFGATLAQIKRLEAAGCDIVRVAVPTKQAAANIGLLKQHTGIPIVADIHFDYRLAVLAAEAGADKIRINPGNIGGEDNVKTVAEACKRHGIPIRIGINGGSLEKSLLAKYGGITARAMVESAVTQAKMLERFGMSDICISLKASSVCTTVEANRIAAGETDYPLHIGVTEAGAGRDAVIKSAAGIGSLLLDKIGDTIRFSLTEEPEEEAAAGVALLRVLGLRKDTVEIISCPTCGRTQIDLFSLLRDVKQGLEGCRRPVKVAVMGCPVNGPGEAADADYGIAGGKDYGILFRHGRTVAKLPFGELSAALCKMVLEDDC
ncbi:MAG: flavodoxin-dependent (E)-4-hydroxy-3-methylbut-2-enyl-diphosphate synthase [Clostridiales bacterium]|nr:flavodoxin-dependent (E)-4-hydroxy-3-methylbut-2-enyl-diphosphate synthase [Clostridiales bacterium]